MQEPPPKLTMPSIASRRAFSIAACTIVAGRWERTLSNFVTMARPRRAMSATPSSEAARPAVVTSMSRRAPKSFAISLTRSTVFTPKYKRCV